ncbi:MAG TPA: M28 family peptidase [Rudaea sp.]|jgi:Zn-dependent M28 family amino/carboxypeptidase|uniref:M28 family peptidase n=1 Tax=Rudaea sp. TaxID=2136325 RepID=UPI002F94EA40
MRMTISLAALALTIGSATAADMPPPNEPAGLREIPEQVSADELHATIAKLVGFGTRHTLSDTKSDKRGIGAARRWVQARFAAIGKDCGGCLEIVTPAQTVTGTRIPQPTEVMDVVAIQRGTSDPNRVVVISGHLDSRVTDVMNAKSDAPGANDDGSGSATVIEAARVLSKHKFSATIVYGVLSGEEQGLYGGKVLADYAKQQGWQVETDLNNDIVGNTHGQDGVVDNTTVRVFSEGTKSSETLDQAKYRRYHGGEVDSPSRNVARMLADLAEKYLTNFHVQMVYRTDRYGRGGDQVPFLEAGFPAVRVTEAHENYTRQHQDLRSENGVRYGDTIDGVDFAYLAQVARLNALTLASLAAAPAPPSGVDIEGAVGSDTTIHWQPVAGAAGYRVWWRDTTAARWQHSRWVGDASRATLKDTVVDDSFFGVSAVSADGFASPVVFAGPAGSFAGAGADKAQP